MPEYLDGRRHQRRIPGRNGPIRELERVFHPDPGLDPAAPGVLEKWPAAVVETVQQRLTPTLDTAHEPEQIRFLRNYSNYLTPKTGLLSTDTLAGIDVKEENHEVADILVDLIRRETHTYSVRFARSLVGELSPTVALINNPHRSAGFKVLRAPDVPSVLVELGYLSNEKDEEQLLSPDWRGKAVDRIASAIALFAAAKTAAGG